LSGVSLIGDCKGVYPLPRRFFFQQR